MKYYTQGYAKAEAQRWGIKLSTVEKILSFIEDFLLLAQEPVEDRVINYIDTIKYKYYGTKIKNFALCEFCKVVGSTLAQRSLRLNNILTDILEKDDTTFH